jgi:hypothetical protein
VCFTVMSGLVHEQRTLLLALLQRWMDRFVV